MSSLDALYYPAWSPSPTWLKSYLLFSDKVRVVVPDDVEPDFGPANQALMDDAPDLFEVHRYTQGDVSLDVELRILDAAFAEIATTKSQKVTRTYSINIRPGGGSTVPGYVFLHRSKLTDGVNKLLHEHALCLDGVGAAPDKYLVVQEDA